MYFVDMKYMSVVIAERQNSFDMITAQRMKFSINGFFSKYDQIRRKLQIWSHLLKKSLMKNFIFCAVDILQFYQKQLCVECS